MSTPYELPVAPDLVQVPRDLDASALPVRAPLRVVPDEENAEPVDFDDFVRRHSPRLRRLIVRKLRDLSEAEEITQETLLRAHQHLHTLRTENELIAWTTVVGQRLAIDRLRVRGRSVAVAQVPEDSRVGRDTADIVVARAEARTALEALEAIPERQAAILWAREVEGLQYDAIAERFDITEPAVRSLLHRGRKALRVEYAARGGTLPFKGLLPLGPGLVALRGLGRLRSAARSTVKGGNVGVFATLSVAGALALGMSVGPSAIVNPGRAEHRVGADRMTQQTFGEDLFAGAVVAAGAEHARSTAGVTPALGTTALGRAVGTNCITTAERRGCLSEAPQRGDVLYIGGPLPTNPVAERVGVSQTLVGVCRVLPGTPVTECRQGSQSRTPVGTPTVIVPPQSLAAPSTREGAQK